MKIPKIKIRIPRTEKEYEIGLKSFNINRKYRMIFVITIKK